MHCGSVIELRVNLHSTHHSSGVVGYHFLHDVNGAVAKAAVVEAKAPVPAGEKEECTPPYPFFIDKVDSTWYVVVLEGAVVLCCSEQGFYRKNSPLYSL